MAVLCETEKVRMSEEVRLDLVESAAQCGAVPGTSNEMGGEYGVATRLLLLGGQAGGDI